MTIYYADDGEAISSHIKNYFEEGRRFQLQVSTVNVGGGQDSKQNNRCSLSSALLTPDMLHDLERKPKDYLSNVCKQGQKRAFLCHDSVDLTDSNNESILSNACSDYDQWNKISLGNSNENYKMALLSIMQLMESTPNASPVLIEYKIIPKKISSVSIIYLCG